MSSKHKYIQSLGPLAFPKEFYHSHATHAHTCRISQLGLKIYVNCGRKSRSLKPVHCSMAVPVRELTVKWFGFIEFHLNFDDKFINIVFCPWNSLSQNTHPCQQKNISMFSREWGLYDVHIFVRAPCVFGLLIEASLNSALGGPPPPSNQCNHHNQDFS